MKDDYIEWFTNELIKINKQETKDTIIVCIVILIVFLMIGLVLI